MIAGALEHCVGLAVRDITHDTLVYRVTLKNARFHTHLQAYIWHCQALLVLMTASIAAFGVLPLLSATGRQRRVQFQIQSPVADVEHFVSELLEELEGMGLYYWVQLLYMPGGYNAKY